MCGPTLLTDGLHWASVASSFLLMLHSCLGCMLRVSIRAAVIPVLESELEPDFGSFWMTNHGDSGSGSFSSESLESAPLPEPIPRANIGIKYDKYFNQIP